MIGEFFMISISAISARSVRSKGELPVSGFVGIEYLLMYTAGSQHR